MGWPGEAEDCRTVPLGFPPTQTSLALLVEKPQDRLFEVFDLFFHFNRNWPDPNVAVGMWLMF